MHDWLQAARAQCRMTLPSGAAVPCADSDAASEHGKGAWGHGWLQAARAPCRMTVPFGAADK